MAERFKTKYGFGELSIGDSIIVECRYSRDKHTDIQNAAQQYANRKGRDQWAFKTQRVHANEQHGDGVRVTRIHPSEKKRRITRWDTSNILLANAARWKRLADIFKVIELMREKYYIKEICAIDPRMKRWAWAIRKWKLGQGNPSAKFDRVIDQFEHVVWQLRRKRNGAL